MGRLADIEDAKVIGNILFMKGDLGSINGTMGKQKIKILHIAECAGGVDRYLRYLLKYMNHDRFENILLCSFKYKKEDYEHLADYIEQMDIKHGIGIKSLKSIFSVRKIIKKYNPDIVYAHSSIAGAITRMADIGIENHLVYNPHGWSFNMQCKNIKKQFYRIIEKFMSHYTDIIVCISDAEKKSALNRKICNENKLYVIYNGIDINGYDLTQNTLSKETIGISEASFVVGTVGRLSNQKAPDVFIKAAALIKKEIPNAFFLMIGGGDKYDEIVNLAEYFGLQESYKIVEWVDNPIDYIRLFDVALLLSRWEGFGLVLPEYMLVRKPIVATNVDAIPWLIKDGKNGILIPVDDGEAVCKAVVKLYNDNDLYNRLADQGASDVLEKFNAKRMSEEYEELFKTLITAG